ncbi:MAG: type 2 lantipeptide synthetase LanM [Pirellulales bacterium]|nr:type 2 lantipeptide synthetase LanM [Pirellulales bacterium]
MRSTAASSIHWCRAATLAERAEALFGAHRDHRGAATVNYDATLAERRHQQWQQQASMPAAANLADHLASERLTQAQWLQLLGTDPEALCDRLASARWFQDLLKVEEQLLSLSTDQVDDELARELGLLNLFAPTIRAARERLRDGLHALQFGGAALPAEAVALERLFFAQLLPVLQAMVRGTLVLELNVARLQGHLAGDTPEERYLDFVRSLRTPDVASAMLDEYPLLARQVLVALDQWVRFGLKFFEHVSNDWPRLRETFRLQEAGELVALAGAAGDRHAEGQSVQILRFASGARLVYKPKSLAAEAGFQSLLTWCNERGANPPLRTLGILDCGDHSWVEFVEAHACQTADEVRRFYQRQGAYLALLYVVGATDLHFENLVAAGEHPMFIDLEAIFHQRPTREELDPATQALSESVLAVRLLPQTAYVDGIDQPVDFSGLGATAGQTLPYLAARWQGADTDDMRLGLEQAQLPPGHHLPTLCDQPIDLSEFGADLLTGFERMYELLAEHRDELLAAGGPLECFAEVEVRHIARITQIYSILRDMTWHPDRLRDALDRDRWVDRLWAQANDFPTLARLIAVERADLYRNDIPLFTTRPGSRDLFTSTGERIAGYFERSGLDLARERIARLGADDLARQSWLIRATLAILPTNVLRNLPAVEARRGTAEVGTSLAAAIQFGNRLAELAWQSDDRAGWLSCLEYPRGWTLGPLGLDLGSGLPGVVLFLAELGVLGGEDRFVTLARKALNTIYRRLSATGVASTDELRELISVLTYLQSVVGDAKFARTAQRTVDAAQRSLAASMVDAAESKASSKSAAMSVPPPGVVVPGLRDGLAGQGRSLLHAAIQAHLMEESLPS